MQLARLLEKQNIIKLCFKKLFLFAFSGATVLTVNQCFASSITVDAKMTVEKFYESISDQQCEEAIRIRLGYTLENCEKIDRLYLHQAEISASNEENAIAFIEIDTESKKKNHYFKGYTRLQKIRKKWYIVGPYKNLYNYSLDEYIQEFIPADVNLTKTIRNKSEKTHQKIVTNKTNITEKIHKKDKRVTSLRSLPPGDAIDVAPKVSVMQSSGSPKIKGNRSSEVRATEKVKRAGHLSEANLELDNYLKGRLHIEGNFTILLKNIRDLFPGPSTAVILVDQSQGLLYLYSEDNELLGLFPVLTSPITNFPKGLYKIHEEEVRKNEDQPENTASMLMEKMVLSDTGKILIKGEFFLRSYFDSDQRNSLALSPFDNNRLHGLVGGEVLVYVAN